MKQLVRSNYLLFSILFLSNITCADENIIAERKIVSSRVSLFKSSTKQYRSQEGFCANTLIQTPFGYKAIKKLSQGDIVISCNGKEEKIIAITKHQVNRCIKLIVDNTIIYTGYDQLYYRFPTTACVAARNIKVGDMLLNHVNEGCTVTYVELMNENKLLYYLTVEGHIFCIAPSDLYVHNAEPLILGLSSMCLGNVIIINPIVATLGVAIALSAIAQKAYQTYVQQYGDNGSTIPLPTDVICAERSYYIQRSTALGAIKQELLYIKNGLENLKAFCGSSPSFTYQFLKQTAPVSARQQNLHLQISSTREMQLSDKQKENLRTLREIDLEHTEQEIVTLQTTLAFHINELIEQVYAADDECKNAAEEIDGATNLWNQNCDKMTDSIALRSYKANLLDEYLLNNLDQKVNELKIVAHYYHNCMKTVCIKQSTNIFDLLEKMNSVIIEWDQRITKEKSRIAQNIFVSEQYFGRRGFSAGQIKNETKNYLEKGKNGRNVQAIAEAKNKLESIVVAGSPQNNNNENKNDKNEYPFGKYKDAPYHTNFGNSIKSKAPSNGQRALDNSVSIGQNTSRRIGISDGEIVVLDQTSPGLFHGHVRSWTDLTQEMKNALTNSNLVSLKGKIK